MDHLTQSWTRLTISEREGPGCCLTNEDSSTEFSIAAKFLTKRALNCDVLAKTFTPLWRARNGFKIKRIGDHIILFIFDNKDDVDRILKSEPWSFNKHPVIMPPCEFDMSIQELKFDRTIFWVQVHGIPLRFMNVGAAMKICSVLGSFMRIQVAIDIKLP